jgi:hypothetical protein
LDFCSWLVLCYRLFWVCLPLKSQCIEPSN